MNPDVLNVYGPPGTGKTTFCINTVQEWLLTGVDPQRIGYYTFTKVAANEAMWRATEQTDYSASDFEWFKTLHAAAYRLLNLHQNQVVDASRLEPFMKQIGFPYNRWATEDDYQENNTNLREGNVLEKIWSYGRNRLAESADEAWDASPYEDHIRTDRENFRFFVREYETWKRTKNYLDFTDMLQQAILRGETTGCTHVIIDEAQDLTPLQWRMAKLIEADAYAVRRAGDDDQGLYGFAGADPKDFINIAGRQHVLSQSYRVPSAVHTEAQRIIQQNKNRVPKEYKPRGEVGSFTRQYSMLPPAIPSEGTVAKLFRNKKHLRTEAERLMDENVPFGSDRFKAPLSNGTLTAGLRGLYRWLDRGTVSIDDALAVLDMVSKTPLSGHFIPYGARQRLERIAHSHPFQQVSDLGLSPEGVAAAKKDPLLLADSVKGTRAGDLDYLARVIQKHGIGVLNQKPRLTLTTIHGSKGAEFDHVFISQDASRSCQDGLSEDAEGENRCKYVACTRARQTVTILPEMAEGGWSL